ncbi:phosphodiester glycosidase family protein [Streptomyces sp. NBC_01264]|uniref:phosphodiester glycosidase family protein n=1 Tax=Streptomyces sp. NBC_01264 TaxID=2903804 RepID=UPI0022537518|nr:phosphodiester glycosidase family protein [Streptomyces sp. NBC_01264]MCX4783295.1 phosphodiester glycosidase family protein [Streptomyces sp. NBC_01264]
MARRARLAAALAMTLTLAGCSSGTDFPEPGFSTLAPVPDGALPRGVTYKEFARKLDGRAVSHVQMLAIRPDAEVRVGAVHGSSLAHAETVREMAAATGAVAAVNASYFDISTGKNYGGYDGDPLGLYTEGGRLLSEATNGRTALLLGTRDGRLDARIDEVTTEGQVISDDGSRGELDGINRVPGRVLGCGGVGGDRLAVTEEPMEEPYGGLCTDADELVAFTEEWGDRTPPGPPGSMEAVLDGDGRVVDLRKPAGGRVPAKGSTLYATGDEVDWLQSHARRGNRIKRSVQMNNMVGLPVGEDVQTAVGGRYRLLKDGESALGAAASTPRKAPRTLAGITEDGALLLVTIDGRNPGVDAGATLAEAAEFMASLGAQDAIGLDGGGSTSMVVLGELRNNPRETPGKVVERPVANALALFAR